MASTQLKWLALSAALVVVACGGGANTDPSKTINGKVVDGYVGGATVCFDRNANNQCDSGEPTASTDTSGNYTLTLLASDSTAGKHVIAMVGVGATDPDAANGTVTTPYAMFAPAASATAVTPLTTMVSSLMIGNPGLSASQAEQQVVVSNNLGGLAPNGVLGVDVARSAELHPVAQAVATIVAQTTATLNQSATFSSAVAGNAVAVNTAATLQAIARAPGVLLTMQGSTGALAPAYTSGSSVNLQQVANATTTTITANINNIASAAATGSTSSGMVNASTVLQNGLMLLTMDSGYYYNSSNAVTSTGTYLPRAEFIQYDLVAQTGNQAQKYLLNNGWVPRVNNAYINYYLLPNGTWAQAPTPNQPTLTASANCIIAANATAGAARQQLCLSEKDLSGKALGTVFNCLDQGGGAIGSCSTSATFPSGSKIYDVQLTALDEIINIGLTNPSVFGSMSWSGYGTTGSADLMGFIAYSQSNLQYVVTNCAVAFKISTWNPSTGTGTIAWYSNANTNPSTGCSQRQISAQPVETSDFTIRSYPASGVNAVRFMTYNAPAIYRIADSSNQVYGVFAEWVNPSTQQKQIYQGDYKPVGLTQLLPSTFNLPLFSNPTTFNFLLTQRGVAPYSYP
ncbi:MAG: hypothetical protein ACKOWD_11925 [Rhodoferax sp.]